MAYQTGTATSPSDLLQQLATWVATAGWTVDSSASDGLGWRLHAHRGAVYVNMRAAVNESSADANFDDRNGSTAWSGIAIYCGTGYSGAAGWKAQAGGPINSSQPTKTFGAGMVLPAGAIVAYHFFSDNDNVMVVAEKTSGVYTHLGWGVSVDKLGSWTGGVYFFGSTPGWLLNDTSVVIANTISAHTPFSWSGWSIDASGAYYKCDVDAYSGWVGNVGNTTVSRGYTGKSGWSLSPLTTDSLNNRGPSYRGYRDRLTSPATSQSLMLPIRILVERSGGASFVGALPMVFACNACAKGFTPAGLYQWGSDNYRVFPGSSSYPNHGYAVKVT